MLREQFFPGVAMELLFYEQMHGASVAVTRTAGANNVVFGVEIVFPRPVPAVERDVGQPGALPSSPICAAVPVATEASATALTVPVPPRAVPADTVRTTAAPPTACYRRRWRAGRLAVPAVQAVSIADGA